MEQLTDDVLIETIACVGEASQGKIAVGELIQFCGQIHNAGFGERSAGADDDGAASGTEGVADTEVGGEAVGDDEKQPLLGGDDSGASEIGHLYTIMWVFQMAMMIIIVIL